MLHVDFDTNTQRQCQSIRQETLERALEEVAKDSKRYTYILE